MAAKTKKALLSYALSSNEYDFCTEVADKKEGVTYLNENYYKDTHLKYHERGFYFTITLTQNLY